MDSSRLHYNLPVPEIVRSRTYRWLKLAGVASVPAVAFLILLLMSFDLPAASDSPLLLLLLNTLFVTLIAILVAFLAARSFLLSGLATLLLLGCASLAFGSGSFVAGLVVGTRDGVNDSITVHNTAALISAIFHLVGAAFVSFGPAYRRISGSRWFALFVEYGGVLAIIAIVTFASLWGDAPGFFIQGQGPTFLRQLFLGLAVVLFGCASALFFRVYFKSRSELAFWYSLALAMLALGLFTIYPSSSLSDAHNWIGRGIQYLGSIYLLIAILSMRVARGSRQPLEHALTSFFVEAKENYQALVEAATDAIIAVDEEGHVLLWNPGAEKAFGYSASEALDARLVDLVAPLEEEGGSWREFVDLTSRTPASSTRETSARRKTGELFPFEFNVTARNTAAGWIATLIGRDITHRKRAEQERWLGQERLNIALRNTPIIVFTNDRELRYTWVENYDNSYSLQEILGHTDADLFPPEDAERLMAVKRSVLDSGEGRRTEMPVRTRSGQQHFDITIEPLRDADQHIVGLNCVAFNVTRLRRLADEVSLEKRRWQATVEAMLDAVLVGDAQGQIIYANRAAAELSGRSADSALPFQEHPDFFQLYRSDGTLYTAEDLPVQRAALEGVKVRNAEIIHCAPAGTRRNVLWNAAPLYDTAGRVNGAVAIGHDVTHLKQAERQIEELNRTLERRATELESANRELESFSYSVSHDLRSPLASIDSFSRLLLADCGDSLPISGQRYVALIRDNAAAMARLIQDLLSFSRTSRQPLQRQTADMHTLVRQVLDDLRPSYIGRHVDFEIGDLALCQADPALLKQVWSNLLSNALKFTRKREVARIEVGSIAGDMGQATGDKNGDEVQVTGDPFSSAPSPVTCRPSPVTFFVRDNGVGFNFEQADKLFGVFQRYHSEEEYEGTGVGLAIVERIIHRHGGHVWAEAEVDKGAAFFFTVGQ